MRALPVLLGLVAVCGCADPPVDLETQQGPNADRSAAMVVAEAPPAEPRPVDREAELDGLLGRARDSIAGGRVGDDLQTELLASPRPEHRHAARLLAAIAGDAPPDPIRPATEGRLADPSAAGREGAASRRAQPDLLQPEPQPEPRDPEPEGSEPSPSTDPLGIDEPVSERPPLDRYPSDSPVRQWYADLVEVEARLEAEARSAQARSEEADEGLGVLGPWLALIDPPPLLAALPPAPGLGEEPEALAPAEDPSLARGLVILTSLSLDADANVPRVTLSLAGAAPVEVHSKAASTGRVVLWIDGAGAMPSFSLARPETDGVRVVDVRRDGRRVEIEVALAAGWSFVEARGRPNGARVEFAGFD